MDELQKIKDKLLLELGVHYNSLLNFITDNNKLPLNPIFKQYAFLNLDQGLMWIEKGINLLQLPSPDEIKNKNNKEELPVEDIALPVKEVKENN